MHKVLITQFAKDNLKFIYEYYKSTVSILLADKIKKEIKLAILELKNEKVDWQEDDYLRVLKKEHRRFICGNYKIIYYRDSIKQITYITDIFDSRQDPINQTG